MAVLAIRHVPDLVLRTKCAAVADFDEDRLRALTADMLETMYDALGRGLAAPQIGITSRLFVMDVAWKTDRPTPMVFLNPEYTSRSKDLSVMEEACLSIPGKSCLVERPSDLRLRWRRIDGAVIEGAFDGFAARCIQHEMDHLDGILCTDYPAPLKSPAE